MQKELLFLPGPVTVAEPILAAMSRPLIDHRGKAFAELLARIVRRLQPIFGTRGEPVLLGASGTGGLEAAVTSLFKPGETLLAAPVGVFGRRLAGIARTYGCEVEVLDTAWGHALDPAALANRLRADTERKIGGILLTHNETSTGVQNDLAALAAITASHPAMTVVDSVSGLGASPFEMDAWKFDVVVSASQKVFAAPPGVAMVAASERAWAKMESGEPSNFSLSLIKAREFARQGQTPWTPPISVFFALDAALERYEREGAKNVAWRHECYARAIRAAFAALHMKLYSQGLAHSPTVVAALVPEAVDAGALLRNLRDMRGVVLSGGQQELKGEIVRMGTMGDVSQTDVLGALGALEIALLEMDVPVKVGSGVQAALRIFLDMDAPALTPGGRQSNDARTDAQTKATSP